MILERLKKFEKPNISNIDGNAITKLFQNKEIQALIQKSFHPYVYWDKVKYWSLPDNVSNLEVWSAIKTLRHLNEKKTVILGEDNMSFSWNPFLSNVDEFLHNIDIEMKDGAILSDYSNNEIFNRQLLNHGIIEESIASSQLEGAHSSRKAARAMILENRKPKTKDEVMIMNNYQVMRLIETELKDKELSEEVLFSMHKMFMQGNLDKKEIGRYRKNSDEIIVADDGSQRDIYHIPPKEKFVIKEMERLINYANDKLLDEEFIHPVIKAIILHFWIGYLHPFVDGNGRTARAIFYWYLLRHGYWAFSYIPLSRIIKDSPVQYRDSYMYSEQDDNDLTYFLEYNIDRISRGIKEFKEYAIAKLQETQRIAKIAKGKYDLNDRQIQLLEDCYKDKNVNMFVNIYSKIYKISRITATRDLRRLEELGFVKTKKTGRTIFYYSTDKISEIFS